MPKKTKLAISVNCSSLLRTLQHSFSNDLSLIKELAQNAERAGATMISFEHDVKSSVLTIKDNGTTPVDFDALLTIGNSGWSLDVMSEQQPFGIGFLSAIYVSDNLKIESGGKSIEADTESLLNQKEVTVINSSVESGTVITLHLKGSSNKKISQYFTSNGRLSDADEDFRHFPIDVFVNGRAIERKLSAESLSNNASYIRIVKDGISFFIPSIHPVGLTKGSFGISILCQGFKMSEDNMPFGRSAGTIYAFLGKGWLPRVPDRTSLFNSAESEKKIFKMANEVAASYIKSLVGELSNRQIMKACTAFDLLCEDMLFLVKGSLQFSFSDFDIFTLGEIPRLDRNLHNDYSELPELDPCKMIEGKPFLLKTGKFAVEDKSITLDEPSQSIGFAYIVATQTPIIFVPECLVDLDIFKAGIDFEDFVNSSRFEVSFPDGFSEIDSYFWGFSTVILTEKAVISVDLAEFEPVTISHDNPIAFVDSVFSKGHGYIVSNLNDATRYAESLIIQSYNFVDEYDSYNEDYENESCCDFKNLIISHLGGHMTALNEYLNKVPRYILQALAGSNVTISVADDCSLTVTQ